MRPLRFAPVITLSLTLSCLAGLVRASHALPSFARASGESCEDCHSAGPRLNAAGVAFAERGYRDASNGLKPAHELPISIVGGTGFGVSDPGAGLRGDATLHSIPDGSLRGNGLHAAGVFARRFTYHAQVGMGTRDEEPRTDAAYVQLDDLFGGPALNLRVGRFDAEMPFLSRARRTTLAGYLSPTTFDARGLELNGRASSWAYAAGLAFSDRRISGGPTPRNITAPLEDSYLRVVRDEGPWSFGAQMLFDRQDSSLRTLSWLQHLRAQLSATAELSRITLTPSYVFDRFDDRPGPGIHERHQYYMIEAVTRLDPEGRWAMTSRYEHDYRTRNAINPEADRELEAVNVAWRAVENAWVAVEWSSSGNLGTHRRPEQVDAFVRASW